MQNDIEYLNEKQKELFIKKSTRIADSYLKRIESMKDTPIAVRPFLQVLKDTYINLKEKSFSNPTIGTYCIMVPEELIYAVGAVPIRLCSGNYIAYSIGDDYIPRDACPLIKAVVGAYYTKTFPIYENNLMTIIPSSCDCKKKMAGIVKDFKSTYIMNMPPNRIGDSNIEQYMKEFYNLIYVLEQATGNTITPESLQQAINTVGYAQYELSRFMKFRRHNPSLMYGTQVMAVMNSYAYMKADEWGLLMSSLNRELEDRLKNKQFVGKNKQPRILLTGSPVTFPNMKVPLLIEEMGGMLVADETCIGERAMYDPVVVVNPDFDGMVRALANRYIRPCTCPVFADNAQRIYKIKQMIKDHEVQGIIYYVLRGCLVYDYEYKLLEDELADLNIPIIRLESDYNEEDVEQLRIRIEAFIEMIKLKEYNENKKKGGKNE